MTLQYGESEDERASKKVLEASRKSKGCGLSVNLGGQWKREKEGHFPDSLSFIVMGFKKMNI